MAKCELLIELDEAEPIYRPGETISGTVRVVTTDLVKSDGLVLSVDWHTHGKGNRERGSTSKVRLITGDLPAGEHDFPLEFEAPREPRSYYGEHLNVDFEIRAALDVPWGFDPTANQEIAIRHDDVGYVIAPVAPERGSRSGGCLLSALLTVLGGFAILFFAYQSSEITGQVGCGSIIVGLLGMAVVLPRWLTERKTGAITVNLAQGTPGGYREVSDLSQLRCEIQLGRAGVRVNGVTAKLSVVEVVTKGSGSNSSGYSHDIYSSAGKLDSDAEALTVNLQLPSPGEAPFPFKARSNKIDWYIDVHVDIERGAPWEGRFDLTVTPAKERG